MPLPSISTMNRLLTMMVRLPLLVSLSHFSKPGASPILIDFSYAVLGFLLVVAGQEHRKRRHEHLVERRVRDLAVTVASPFMSLTDASAKFTGAVMRSPVGFSRSQPEGVGQQRDQIPEADRIDRLDVRVAADGRAKAGGEIAEAFGGGFGALLELLGVLLDRFGLLFFRGFPAGDKDHRRQRQQATATAIDDSRLH